MDCQRYLLECVRAAVKTGCYWAQFCTRCLCSQSTWASIHSFVFIFTEGRRGPRVITTLGFELFWTGEFCSCDEFLTSLYFIITNPMVGSWELRFWSPQEKSEIQILLRWIIRNVWRWLTEIYIQTMVVFISFNVLLAGVNFLSTVFSAICSDSFLWDHLQNAVFQ